MRERSTFWLVTGLSALLIVTVTAAIVYAGFDEEAIGATEGATEYLGIFGLVFADAIIPIFPGETTLNTASVLASQGELALGWVIVASAIGAILGDSALYWIARTGPTGLKTRLVATSENNASVAKGLALLGRSGSLLIVCGRFVPGVRFAVNVSMGLVEYPYRRFLVYSSIGGSLWAAYTCLLAYWVGSALSGFPVGSILISGLITTILIAVVYLVDRRRRRAEDEAAAAAMREADAGRA